MKFAAVSDIHGNLPALEAVLADIAREGVDAIVNLGDIVCGPLWPAETADRLMPLNWPTLAGNHERQVLTQALAEMSDTDAHTAPLLGPVHREWLARLPPTLRWQADVLLCHGTPTSDLTYLMETVTPDYAPGKDPGVRAATRAELQGRLGDAMSGVPHALILCGHTHVPRCERLEDGRMVVNPGSVGLPAYDDDHPHFHLIENGAPQARYALLTRKPGGWGVKLRRVDYDAEAAARQAERHQRPDWAVALRTGRMNA
ncbi:metallophosphoesterase family protein [Sphaerotilaceae bacterium SBD11-9]